MLRLIEAYTENMEKQNCYTYFAIEGDFDIDEVTNLLGIKPSKSWKKTDLRKDGKPFGFDFIEMCRNENYDPYVYQMMEITIEPLIDKIEALKEIKKKYDVKFYLVVVPSLATEGVNPAVSPSLKVMDFCHEARCELDIDLYVY